MPCCPIYSKDLSDAKIRRIFCRARVDKRISCKKCRSYRIRKQSDTIFRCLRCWTRFSFTSGTWLDHTKLPLRLWYEITWCFVLGHPAYKTHRILGTTDDILCWRGYHTIRKVLVADGQQRKRQFFGTVEIDESYYGGKFKNLRKETRERLRRLGLAKRGRGAKYRKQPVFGVYQRDGEVYLELTTETTAKVLEPKIKQQVRQGSRIYSDTHTGYINLVGLGYIHRTIDHGKQEYTVGSIHINGLEGFWGLSKNTMAVYKGIRKHNWIFYLKEMEFRYNHRRFTFEQQVEKLIKLLMTDRN